MPQGLIRPTNQIAVGEVRSREYEIGANATAAKMLPGIFVEYDTVDYAVKECGAESDAVIGVLEVAAGKKITDAYARGDQAKVIIRGTAMITLVSGSGAVVPGTPISTGADGKGAATTTGAIGTQGAIAAYSLETVNPAGSDLPCLVEVVMQRENIA